MRREKHIKGAGRVFKRWPNRVRCLSLACNKDSDKGWPFVIIGGSYEFKGDIRNGVDLGVIRVRVSADGVKG